MFEQELVELAGQFPVVAEERRAELLSVLSMGSNRYYNRGLVEGLLIARRIAGDSAALTELIAAAVARALEQDRLMTMIQQKYDTPEVRAEIEREIARIDSGEAVPISGEESLRRVREGVEQKKATSPGDHAA